MPQGHRRLAAIMFTDMVGYTALGQKNETLSLALVEEQRILIRPVIAKHGGREVKTIGDAFLIEFPNAIDAVRCAYDIQRVIREFNLSLASDKRIFLRIGIHLGEVVEAEGDISGDAVNIASRIEPLAVDGGVCLSRQVYDHVKNKLDLRLSGLGPKTLKNLVEPLEVFRIIMPWEEEVGYPIARPDKTRLVVLPFSNLSPDPNDSYFADGVTEEIISTVSSISGLRVISRTSAMGYKGTTKRLTEIGKELGVGSVLEGSFRKVGNRIRIAAQLIDVMSDEHLWSQNYDRELGDVFLVQSDVARQVADSLRVKILPREEKHIGKAPTESPEAHALYLEGKYYWNKRSEKDLLKAIELFAEAAKVDPDYALAYSGLADCYGVLGDHRYLPYLEAFSKQKEYALKAVELDPISAEAHTSLAQSFMNNDRDLVSAANEHEKAIELSPSYATSYHWYGVCLTYLGRPEEALEQSKKAQDLDPLSPQIASFAGLCYLPLGKYDLAERQQFRALDLQPSFVPAITNLRYTYFAEKKYSEAEYENLEYLKVTGDSRGSKFFQAAILANSGRGDEARKTMEEAKASPGFGDFREYQMLYHIGLGEEESAIKLVQLEYDSGAHWLGAITEYPMFTRIRNDPRVKEILRKTGVRVTRE